MREMGAEGPSFDTIVAFGTNAARPHAVPTDRILRAGDLVLIDMGLILDGYCSVMTRTFVVGKPDQTFIERHRAVRKAMLAGIQAIRAGVTGVEVDRAARQVLADAGYGEAFGHGLGHGVGVAVTRSRGSRPWHQTAAGRDGGHGEPGLYLADWGGIRLENMILVTEKGAEVLNRDTTSLDL
jgi:Xaa-Pro aminopeptidase